ncbi:MAG: ATP-binding protein [Intrasporangium sp.]|uniref:ATP-binding protein n=1 Tax=Intrasporangium sp. TaxID=1925024 RepID=UPI0026485C3B|nr:ATP-binding protein [Intrasporangium sp.]MDN5794925.1 ATP-binding protein [Intrasporangium sp.]
MWIPRSAEAVLRTRLRTSAAVVLLGPRQVGKTTMARDVTRDWPGGANYLDLERPADRRRLEDADAYLRSQSGRLVVLDEVHRVPSLFEVLRGVIDDNRRAGHRTGQFLLLGSASLDLVHMSSESLAGRISYIDLGGVDVDEADDVGLDEDMVWVRGGFPDSLTAGSDVESVRWRADLIRSYLERDVPMFAPRIPAETLRRLWTMVAHSSGTLLNSSRLAAGLGVSGPTVDRYLDLLADLGLLRRLQPWHANTGKRVTKSPKVFVRDTGLLHALLELTSVDDVLAHPSAGPSYESFAVECLIQAAGEALRPYHYRTARGDEIDLVLVRGGRPVAAIEVKRSTAPAVSAGFHRAVADIGADHRFIVHPDTGEPPYATGGDAVVIGLTALVKRLRHGFR